MPAERFAHVETWVFDLDNTLYPPEIALFDQINVRKTEYVMRIAGVDREEADRLRHAYWREHGTTLAGLMLHHGIDPGLEAERAFPARVDKSGKTGLDVRAVFIANTLNLNRQGIGLLRRGRAGAGAAQGAHTNDRHRQKRGERQNGQREPVDFRTTCGRHGAYSTRDDFTGIRT